MFVHAGMSTEFRVRDSVCDLDSHDRLEIVGLD
jgi:hypothetical protein